ncbi:dicarboxylate transporter/tellurite-resistance protein TehA [Paraburkholderia sp. BCC1886]|uniref:dicarboxylate transporter/tellurite-resistance protein TehA n=1 Tax=Paraburkholderia sp. BCC1886 TaxID=2562670 RepID=UPI0011836B95|nr:dicarboxylate transporter/tellurite-resistance protein TehA [Paraburkholderia sp. BCC1886]
MENTRRFIPVGFFGIAVGLLALANAWRVAVRIWGFPADAATAFTIVSVAFWLFLVAMYLQKWIADRSTAQAELADPMQSQFVSLLPVSTLLAAQAVLAYSRTLAIALFVLGIAGELMLGLSFQGRLWQGGRKPELVTPAIYLPTVAPGFVGATAAATLGWPHLAAWLFGAGLLSWLAIESIILHRVAVNEPMAPALRPTLGVQLAPPVVGGVAYLALTGGVPDLFAQLLFGYGLFQALLIIRLLPWVRQQPFNAGYWAFSFGVAALPTMAMRMVERGATGAIQWLAIGLFIVANIVIAILIARTLQLLATGKLLPAAAARIASLPEKPAAALRAQAVGKV